MAEYIKIEKEYVEKLVKWISDAHNNIIDESGGEKGIRDDGGLYFSSHKILEYISKNEKKPFSVGAFIYEEFARKHHFVDGNKRTAHLIAKIFSIAEFGYHLKIDYEEAVPFIISIAEFNSQITHKEICLWIEKNSIKITNFEKYLNNPRH